MQITFTYEITRAAWVHPHHLSHAHLDLVPRDVELRAEVTKQGDGLYTVTPVDTEAWDAADLNTAELIGAEEAAIEAFEGRMAA
jgi:hypothetical protein